MAFFSAPDIEWLYSGVTKTYASKEPIFAAHLRVWGRLYWPTRGGTGSSKWGSA